MIEIEQNAVRRFTCRKFLFGAFFAGTGFIGLMYDKLSGDQYVILVGLIIGLYSHADVTHKKNVMKNEQVQR